MIHNGTKLMLTSFLTYMLSCTLVGVLFCPASCSAASVSYPDGIKNTMEIFKSDEDAAKRVTDLVSLAKAKQALEERGMERKDLLATLMQLNGKADDSNSPLSQLKLFPRIAIADKNEISEEDADNKADAVNFEEKYPKFLSKPVDLTTIEPVQPITPGPVRYASYLTEASVPLSQEPAGKFENIRQLNPQEERSSTEEIATQRSIELNQLDENIPISPSKKRLVGKLRVGNVAPENTFSKVFINSNVASQEISTENESNARQQSNSKEMSEENEDTRSIIVKQPVRQSSPRMMTNNPQGNQIDIDEGLKNEDLNNENTNITEKPTNSEDEDEVATEKRILSKMFSNAKELLKKSNDQITMIRKPQDSQDLDEETPKSKQREQVIENTNFTEKVPEMEERQEVTTEKEMYSKARPEEVSRESEDEEPIAQKVQRRNLRTQEGKPQKIDIDERLKEEDLNDENTNITEKPTNNEDEDEVATEKRILSKMFSNAKELFKKSDDQITMISKPQESQDLDEESPKSKQREQVVENTNFTEKVPEMEERQEVTTEKDMYSKARPEEVSRESEDEEPIAQKVQRRNLRTQEGKPQKNPIGDEDEPNRDDTNINEKLSEIEREQKVTNIKENDSEETEPEEQHRRQRSTTEQEVTLEKIKKSLDEEQIDNDKTFLEYPKPTEKVPELNVRTSTTEKVPELNDRTSYEKALEIGTEFNTLTGKEILSKIQATSEENENIVPLVGKLSSQSTTNMLKEILQKNQKSLEGVANGEENQSSEQTTTEKLPEIENVQETEENLTEIKNYSQNMKDRSSLERDDVQLEEEPKSDKQQENHDTEGSSSEKEGQLSESSTEVVKEHNISSDQTEEMAVIQNNQTETENKGVPAGYFPLPAMDDIKEIPDSDNAQNTTFQEGILKLLNRLGGKQKLQEIFENDQGDPRALAEKLVKKAIISINNENAIIEDENSSNDRSMTRESEVQQQKSDNLNEAIEEERDITKPYDVNDKQLNETNTFEPYSTTEVPTSAVVRSEDIASKYQTDGTTSTTEKIVEALTSAAEEGALKGTLENSKDDEYITKQKNNKGKIVFITSSEGATERQEDSLEEGKKVNPDNEEVNESLVKDLDQETTDEPATSTQKVLTETNGKLIPISIFEVININNKINGSQLEEKKYNKDVDEEINMIENEIPQNDKLQITPEEEERQKIKSESDKKSRKSINKSGKKEDKDNSLSSDEDNEEEEPAKRKEDIDYKQNLRNKGELENKNVTDDHEDLETDNSEGTTTSKPTEKISKKKLKTEDDSINPEKTNEGIS